MKAKKRTPRSAAPLILCLATLLPLPALAAPPSGNPSRGAAFYESHCGACHSLDANRVGPMHRGVVGRKAGSVAGFHYTHALAVSGIVWTADALDRWLTNPQAMVPGTAMGLRVASPQDRADVIAYLRQQAVARK
jgi:cytochrome c